jgi:S-formylglutathione hydrolase FrmB
MTIRGDAMFEVGRGVRTWGRVAAVSLLVLVTAGAGCSGGDDDGDGAGRGRGSGEGEQAGGGAPEARPELPEPDAHGIALDGWELVDAAAPADQWRLADATVMTAAVFRPGEGAEESEVGSIPVGVRILLPPGYDPDRGEPYPVLYLLHGGNGDYRSWSAPPTTSPDQEGGGDIVALMSGQSDFEGIVVMPDGGRAGWYSDWVGETAGRFRPAWETFHMEQLVPWVDANFNTSADRSGRAIAGLSMGGYGALRYAARYPDELSAVGALSPGTDISPVQSQSIVDASLLVLGASVSETGAAPPPALQAEPEYLFPPDLDTREERLEAALGPRSDWPQSNPLDLAAEYEPFDGRLALYSGNTADDVYIGQMTDAFHAALSSNGVGHRYCRGPGAHDWPYWRADLQDFLQHIYGTTPSTCTTNQGWSPVP